MSTLPPSRPSLLPGLSSQFLSKEAPSQLTHPLTNQFAKITAKKEEHKSPQHNSLQKRVQSLPPLGNSKPAEEAHLEITDEDFDRIINLDVKAPANSPENSPRKAQSNGEFLTIAGGMSFTSSALRKAKPIQRTPSPASLEELRVEPEGNDKYKALLQKAFDKLTLSRQ